MARQRGHDSTVMTSPQRYIVRMSLFLVVVVAAAAALASAMLPRDTEPVAIRVPAE